jgi:hypothetical protein
MAPSFGPEMLAEVQILAKVAVVTPRLKTSAPALRTISWW